MEGGGWFWDGWRKRLNKAPDFVGRFLCLFGFPAKLGKSNKKLNMKINTSSLRHD